MLVSMMLCYGIPAAQGVRVAQPLVIMIMPAWKVCMRILESICPKA